MNPDMSILALFLNASLLVKLVMGLLLVASLLSWMVIGRKWLELKRARKEVDQFEERFWSGVDLVELYRFFTQPPAGSDEKRPPPRTHTGASAIFIRGFSEFARLRKHSSAEPMAIVEGASRAMRVESTKELDRLEGQLPLLATIGSTSPYIGLFGTVWGIMNAFRALGSAQHATLAMVAPGIAEALVATAMGLFAAIPAVIAYNRYTHQVEQLEHRLDIFREEFSTVLQRQVHAGRGEGG